MKRFLQLLLIIFSASRLNAQDITPVKPPVYSSGINNYIRTWIPAIPSSSSGLIVSFAPIPAYSMTTEYFDGLGRPLQVVQKQAAQATGDSAVDLVTATVYDDYGRQVRNYLPFAANTTGGNTSLNDGLLKMNPFDQQAYYYSDANPNSPIFGQGQTFYYDKTDYESSPLNRVKKVYPPGNSFVNEGRGTTTIETINTVADSVRRWTVTNVSGSFGNYATSGTYAVGDLFKTITEDPQGNQVVEFKDHQGLLILKKVQVTSADDTGAGKGHAGWICTYYVYDNLNQLRAVFQPNAVWLMTGSSWVVTSNILNEFCFRFEYDGKRRMAMRRNPGREGIYQVYDARNRLVLSQDGNQRNLNQWTAYKYDSINRPSSTWLWITTTSLSALQAASASSTDYPTITQLTSAAAVLVTQTFYDNYSWVPTGIGLSSTYVSSEASGFMAASNTTFPYAQPVSTPNMRTKGQVTGTMTLVLNTSNYLYNVTFYDDKYRPLQVQKKNVTGGVDVITAQYSFNGQPLMIKNHHAVTGGTPSDLTTMTRFTYDDQWRLLNTYHKINAGAEEWLSANEYNALGKLTKKTLSPAAPLDTLAYTYNIRGWMTSINKNYAAGIHNNNWFGMNIAFDNSNEVGTGNRYDGNISNLIWRSGDDNQRRTYIYAYDLASRLLKATFRQYTNGIWSNGSGKAFHEIIGDGVHPNTAYDQNGNLLQMVHFTAPSTKIDSLIYNYDFVNPGNKVWRITDSYNNPASTLGDFKEIVSGLTQDYGYDWNGNIYYDLNKGISSITYNYLNLPALVSVINKGSVQFDFDAEGSLVQKTVADAANGTSVSQKYLGELLYSSDTLVQIAHPEGRVRRLPDGSYAYDYFIKDHLGSVRVTLTKQSVISSYMTAGMEPENSAIEDQYYYNVEKTRARKPLSYPATDSTNRFAAKLDGDANKTGPAILLHVSAGDTINIRVSSWYKYNGKESPEKQVPLEETALSMAGVTSDPAIKSANQGGVAMSPLAAAIYSLLKYQDQIPETKTKPRAYLNWILLDQDLQPIADDSTLLKKENKGFQQVGAPEELTQHVKQGWVAPQSGYMYVYTTNESPDVDVYYDDLAVTTFSGPLLETNHTYPFGLTISSISSNPGGKLENRLKFTGKEIQHKEFSDGTGLEWYDYVHRSYDPQIGRFLQLDSLSDKYPGLTPYQYASNGPVINVDLDGLEGWLSWFLFGSEPAITRGPMMDGMLEAGAKTAEIAGDLAEAGVKSSKFTPEQLENFARGNAVEKEQLAEMGLQKNTKGIEFIDPKTGEKGITIPDAVTEEGATVEIKFVKSQGRTMQLRGQEKISNDRGTFPILRINQSARISKPLRESSFIIQRYSIAPVSDNTAVRITIP